MSFRIFISIGTILMIITFLLCGENIKIWKRIVSAIVFVVAGVCGTMILAYIEMGRFGGKSFFGAVLISPIIMAIYALIIREKTSDILDICAPAECFMLALMKVQCYLEECCYGIVIGHNQYGKIIRFPSQLTEFAAAIVIGIILLCEVRSNKKSGTVYARYLVIYGICRFVLNLLRETKPFIWILPAGNVWSLVAIAIGIVYLVLQKTRREIKH